MDELLKVTGLHVYYGMIHAVRGISFGVRRGEIVTLIGTNGAGKTIMPHTTIGLLPSSGGEVVYSGQNIAHVPGYQLIRCGFAHVPEGRRIFSQLSVLQNLELDAFMWRSKEEKAESLREIYRRPPCLAERKNQFAGILPDDRQQTLAMGHALMSKPEVLVLNEPSMGLSSIYVNEIFDIIKSIHESGTTVLLVEQNAKKVFSIVSRAYALEMGTIRLSGTAEESSHNAEVKSACLSE